MERLWIGAVSALWLGILTSISPCPLTTNIAAISFIGKRVGRIRQVLLSGLSYTLGRVISYIAMAGIVIAGLLTIPGIANFLQRYMNKVLGPVLILVAAFLLNWIRLDFRGWITGEKMHNQAERGGIWSAGLLGMVFALSLCPTSAALFFGSLIPLSVKYNSRILIPLLFGVGTGLPVLVSAFVIAFSAHSIGAFFNVLIRIDKWARWITGGIFLIAGIYFVLAYIVGV
jgi:cytochrome c-type biogenesis protein